MTKETRHSITPVILAGGSGTRLWPLSRKSYPKQFSKLVENETLFQSCAKRTHTSETLTFERPVVFTNVDFRFIVKEQLEEIGIKPSAIFLEPVGRNTAPAVLAAAYHLAQTDPDAIMLVAPSDHVVPDTALFHAAVEEGIKAVRDGKLVTFGISPTRPETGYGYLMLAPRSGRAGAFPVRKFVEKPDLQFAAEMVASGNYLWNSGVFLFSAKSIITAFEAHAPHICTPVLASKNCAKPDLEFTCLEETHWREAESISLDFAVMEHADNLVAMPYGGHWSDLGGWDAVWRESKKDSHGVVTSENARAIECQNTLLRSENSGQEIVGIGLTNILAVAMPDAVLVADMGRSQDVKRAVDILLQHAARQAQVFPKEHRPWGWFESLVIGARFQVKRIKVRPGGSLSLQSHFLRSEHWIVVEGTAKVTVDQNTELVSENQSVYVPLGSKHRLENPGLVPMVLIEVQTGPYVGEDDILRYEDEYART